MSRLTVANIHFNTSGSERLEYIDGNVKLFTSGSFIFNGNVVGIASVTVKNTAPAVQDSKQGDLWFNSNTGALLLYYSDGNSTQWVSAAPAGEKGEKGDSGAKGDTGAQGIRGPVGPKSVTVPYPSSSENLTLYYNNNVASVIKLSSVIRGANGNVAFIVRYGANRTDTGNIVFSGFCNSNTGNFVTAFANSSINANSWVWMTTSFANTSTEEFHLTLEFA